MSEKISHVRKSLYTNRIMRQ